MKPLILLKAAVSAGCPEGAIGVIQRVSIEATNELMKHKDTNLILATGGECNGKSCVFIRNTCYWVGSW